MHMLVCARDVSHTVHQHFCGRTSYETVLQTHTFLITQNFYNWTIFVDNCRICMQMNSLLSTDTKSFNSHTNLLLQKETSLQTDNFFQQVQNVFTDT